MRKSTVPLESIKIQRKLADDDDLSELIESIQVRSGITHRVLIDEESSVLIDGLRRVEAYRELGHPTIPAVLVNNLDEAVTYMARVRKHGEAARTLTPLRFWEFFSDTERLRFKRTAMLRGRNTTDRAKGSQQQQRELIHQAFPDFNQSTQGAIVVVYRKFAEAREPELLRHYAELRRKLEAGELTPFQVRNKLLDVETVQMQGDIVKGADQRKLFTTAIDQLSGTNSALTRLGDISPEMNEVELRAYMAAFDNERRRLHKFITTLKRRVSEK